MTWPWQSTGHMEFPGWQVFELIAPNLLAHSIIHSVNCLIHTLERVTTRCPKWNGMVDQLEQHWFGTSAACPLLVHTRRWSWWPRFRTSFPVHTDRNGFSSSPHTQCPARWMQFITANRIVPASQAWILTNVNGSVLKVDLRITALGGIYSAQCTYGVDVWPVGQPVLKHNGTSTTTTTVCEIRSAQSTPKSLLLFLSSFHFVSFVGRPSVWWKFSYSNKWRWEESLHGKRMRERHFMNLEHGGCWLLLCYRIHPFTTTTSGLGGPDCTANQIPVPWGQVDHFRYDPMGLFIISTNHNDCVVHQALDCACVRPSDNLQANHLSTQESMHPRHSSIHTRLLDLAKLQSTPFAWHAPVAPILRCHDCRHPEPVSGCPIGRGLVESKLALQPLSTCSPIVSVCHLARVRHCKSYSVHFVFQPNEQVNHITESSKQTTQPTGPETDPVPCANGFVDKCKMIMGKRVAAQIWNLSSIQLAWPAASLTASLFTVSHLTKYWAKAAMATNAPLILAMTSIRCAKG